MDNSVYQLVVNALRSPQVAAILGLILLDVVLGIAAALKTGTFQWRRVADFYKTDVLPYILGYLVLYVAIHLVIPAGILGGQGDFLADGAVLLAWGTLIGALMRSIWVNLRELYGPRVNPDTGE